MPEPLPVRVLTYNVMRFVSPSDKSCTFDKIASALERHKPTLVALNEVDIRGTAHENPIAELARRLGGYHFAFYGHVKGHYGNALLSEYPILRKREMRLRGGSQVQFPVGTTKLNGEKVKEGEKFTIVRGFLQCDIQIGLAEITVGVTHLDHISDKERAIQLQHIVEVLKAENKLDKTVLLGDLNSLTRSDYTPVEWESLEKRHGEKGWNPPEHGCLEVLENEGFWDAYKACREGHLADDDGNHFTTPVDSPMYRIDYCYASVGLKLVPQTAHVRKSIDFSDHFPVLFDFHFLHHEESTTKSPSL
eukprot:m.310581 g.310581  ORF g.310581 m.310581 type:complete len:305 (-) comp16478_c0_seq5:124-1038(-)